MSGLRLRERLHETGELVAVRQHGMAKSDVAGHGRHIRLLREEPPLVGAAVAPDRSPTTAAQHQPLPDHDPLGPHGLGEGLEQRQGLVGDVLEPDDGDGRGRSLEQGRQSLRGCL